MSKDGLSRLGDHFRCGPVAMVATRWGNDEGAREVAQRAGAVAEAMEGAAVVHAAYRLGVGALELRSISNMTGNHQQHVWRLVEALAALSSAVREMVRMLRGNQQDTAISSRPSVTAPGIIPLLKIVCGTNASQSCPVAM